MRQGDNLESIDDLEKYVDETAVVLIFVSRGYFKSLNCLREARCTLDKGKPITLAHDSATYLESYMPLETIKRVECPDELRGPIFGGRDVIPWHRIADFQLVSLKMLSEQLLLGCPQNYIHLDSDSIGLFIPGELPRQKLAFHRRPVLYASPHNPGALAVAKDLTSGMGGRVIVTSDIAETVITHFLLYLNDQTFLHADGERLAHELRNLTMVGRTVQIVMVHENDSASGGCAFSIFFERTPLDLIQTGLYNVRACSCLPPSQICL